MKIACFSFSHAGRDLGNRFLHLNKTSENKHEIHHFANSEIKGGVKTLLDRAWQEYEGFIFISATGIAVRMVAPFIKNKALDPPVLVVDDFGKFSISLLSGHLGGANELARWVADKIGAIPVITTASDNRGIESIDLFAKKNNYQMEDMKSVTELTSMMVNGKTIGFYSETDALIEYNNLLIIKDFKNIDQAIDGMVLVTSSEVEGLHIPHTILRPKNINIGIGCRKGVEGKRIIEAVKETLAYHGLSDKSVKAMGTVEVKKEEVGILDTAKYFNAPLKIFTIDEIKEVEDLFEKSQFVKETIGVYSVSEPCAYLLGGQMLVQKSRHNGITISITKEDKNGEIIRSRNRSRW